MSTAEDTVCLQCGYDLAGLSPGGVCPECAFPTDRSISLHLTSEGRRYLIALLRGAGVAVVGLLLMASGMGAALLLVASGPWRHAEFGLWIAAGGALLWAPGWLLLSVDPPAQVPLKRSAVRWIVRAFAIAHQAGMAFFVVLLVASGVRRIDDWFIGFLWIAVLGGAGWMAGFAYLDDVAEKALRDQGLASRCGWTALAAGFPLLGAMCFVIGFLAAMTGTLLLGAWTLWLIRCRVAGVLKP